MCLLAQARWQSEPSLMATAHSDPKLLDVAGAVVSLPELLPGCVE